VVIRTVPFSSKSLVSLPTRCGAMEAMPIKPWLSSGPLHRSMIPLLHRRIFQPAPHHGSPESGYFSGRIMVIGRVTNGATLADADNTRGPSDPNSAEQLRYALARYLHSLCFRN
jgi:hypothetical protein